MSTIQASNVSDGTTTLGTSYVVNGSAKAWVRYLTTSGTSVDDSFNHSSLVDDATGRTAFNWTNSFASTNYTGSGNNGDRKILNSAYSNTASQGYAILFHVQNLADWDTNKCSIICHGDLA